MSRSRRLVLSSPIAVLLSFVVAGTALGLTWSPRVPVGDFLGGLARIGPSSAVATYFASNSTSYSVFARRSTTSGASWDPAQTLSTNGTNPAVAALDPYIDVVWEQNKRIRYVRSINSGASFGSSSAVSPKGGLAGNPSVARGPNGLVAIAWQDENTNIDKVIVSTDGGTNFGPIANFATTYQGSTTAVAAGDGVVYLGYQSDYSVISVTRSTNGGIAWATPTNASTNAQGYYGELSIVASSTHAYLAYDDINTASSSWGTVRYRRSVDSGATWSTERQLSPTSYKTDHPQIDLYNGVLRAVYGRKTGVGAATYFQKSTDGLNWSAPQLVDSHGDWPFVSDAGNVIVLLQGLDGHAYVRTGS
jgi:hypothetical protein